MVESQLTVLIVAEEATVAEEAAYPLAGLLSLTNFNRLIYLQPSGLLLDSAAFNTLFTCHMEKSMLGISAAVLDDLAGPSVVLIKPSMEAYFESIAFISKKDFSESTFLQDLQLITGPNQASGQLVATTSTLFTPSDDFNATNFLESTSYIHISDRNMPGPEFDAPRDNSIRVKPSNLPARKAWESVYEKYRELRMNVCGLDLEPMPAAKADERK